jgi:hypothetical protein
MAVTAVIEKLYSPGDAPSDEAALEVLLCFHCPGCGYGHSYRIKSTRGRPVWQWNGSMEKPTFTPSLLVNQHDAASRCHLYVADGKIQFLPDCWHGLKGQTVPMDAIT